VFEEVRGAGVPAYDVSNILPAHDTADSVRCHGRREGLTAHYVRDPVVKMMTEHSWQFSTRELRSA